MMKFLRANSKRLMAIFGVILMIAFILPAGFQGASRLGNTRHIVGFIGEQKVYDTDLSRAKQQWEILNRYLFFAPEIARQITGMNQPVPVLPVLAANPQDPLFRQLMDQVNEHPELYYLLQAEAERMGVVITERDAERAFTANGWVVQLPTGQIVELQNITDLGFAAAIKDAVASFLRVRQGYVRAQNVIKISEPMRQLALAGMMQDMQVRVVKFDADELIGQIHAPTPEQLKEQFEKFGDVITGTPPSKENPLGFGYRFPDRVTLHYISVPNAEVRRVVKESRSDYDWEVEAQKFYQNRPQRFAATPGASSTTKSTTAQAMQPFAAVRDEILEELRKPELDRRTRDAQDRINMRLLADWNEFARAHPELQKATTGPATTSPSMTGATTGPSGMPPFSTFEYLKALAADVQKQTGILPTVAAIDQPRSEAELATLPGIGQSLLNALPFSQYAGVLPSAFMIPTKQTETYSLRLLQPSQVLRDDDGSTYVFRLTSALPSARPASMAEVAATVERDWKLARAMDLARSKAQALVDQARAAGGLEAAARAAGLQSKLSGMFSRRNAAGVEPLQLSSAAAASAFRNEAFKLLNIAATQPSARAVTQAATTQPAAPAGAAATLPMTVIDLPQSRNVFAAELVAVKSDSAAELLARESMADGFWLQDLMRPIHDRWFMYDSAVSRLKWQDGSEAGKKAEPKPQS